MHNSQLHTATKSNFTFCSVGKTNTEHKEYVLHNSTYMTSKSRQKESVLIEATLVVSRIRQIGISHSVQLFTTSWTAACQVYLSIELPRQEYWRGFPLPSLGAFPDPGIKLVSSTLQADSLPSETPGKPFGGCGADY